MLTTQKELINLAADAKENHQFGMARDYLEQANGLGFNKDVVQALIEIYFVLEEKDHAYLVIKGLPDLFSDMDIFELYQKVLVEKNYFLEQQKLIKLLEKSVPTEEFNKYKQIIDKNSAQPVELEEQDKIVSWFQSADHKNLTTTDLFVLYQLSTNKFVDLTEDFFLNRHHDNRVKISLISELIMLEIDYEFNFLFDKVIKQFNPKKLNLLNKSAYFLQGQELILNNLMDNPVELQLVLNDFFEILQTLYPFALDFIPDLQNFLAVLTKDKIPQNAQLGAFEREKYQALIDDILQ